MAEALGDALARWERAQRFVDTESRRLIGDLRSGRDDAAADLIFRSVEQLRTRLEQGLAFGAAEAGELVEAMVAGVELGDPELAGRFEQTDCGHAGTGPGAAGTGAGGGSPAGTVRCRGRCSPACASRSGGIWSVGSPPWATRASCSTSTRRCCWRC
ncbi:MAG: hypothetical protein U5R48_00540 [Gammaproteobacteria bacterium]|nr:hypothetical protein [Gammaproteobacteria bacterium]